MRIHYISPFPPASSGIAIYLNDLIEAISKNQPTVQQTVSAISWDEEGAYNAIVSNEYDLQSKENCQKLADWINNQSDIDVVSLQHQFGLYGGEEGDFILEFLQRVKKPVVTTFHNVPIHPDSRNRAFRLDLLKEIARLSSSVNVFMPTLIPVLAQLFDIPKDKINWIPLGLSAVQVSDAERQRIRQKLELDQNFVLLMFGLIREGKGIEQLIEQLPTICQSVPNVKLIIGGQVHREKDTEYLLSLHELVKQYQVEDYVTFETRYFEDDELADLIAAVDVSCALYTNVNYVSSVTVMMAMAAGKPVIATSFVLAEFALADNRGIVVPLTNNGAAIAQAVISLATDRNQATLIGKNAHEFVASFTWDRVANDHLEVFAKAVETQR